MDIEQKCYFPKKVVDGGKEYGGTRAEMIGIQNRRISSLPPQSFETVKKYAYSGRSLAELVHNDTPGQYGAIPAMILLQKGAKFNPGIPQYIQQNYFVIGTGTASILCELEELAHLALTHAWFWKWRVYRKLRPEAYSIHVDNIKSGDSPNNVNISNVLLNNPVLNDVKITGSSYTLRQCYQEGSPAHPAYPAGHAVIIGATSTFLKIMFDGSQKFLPLFTNIYESNSDGSALDVYSGSDKNDITIGNELDKIAWNVAIGRDWAGVHYRTDGTQGMLLGEQIAISFMKDKLRSWIINDPCRKNINIVFKGFKGNEIQISV